MISPRFSSPWHVKSFPYLRVEELIYGELTYEELRYGELTYGELTYGELMEAELRYGEYQALRAVLEALPPHSTSRATY